MLFLRFPPLRSRIEVASGARRRILELFHKDLALISGDETVEVSLQWIERDGLPFEVLRRQRVLNHPIEGLVVQRNHPEADRKTRLSWSEVP